MVQVTTKDGYILGVQRIPVGRTSKTTANRPPILLQHGILLVRTLYTIYLNNVYVRYFYTWGNRLITPTNLHKLGLVTGCCNMAAQFSK